MPIGGFKQSGWGERTGIYGVEEYTQIKSCHIDLATFALGFDEGRDGGSI
jgi:acyl-CoA reductase-like NAD-dependent aldehyde dehydrogenase